MAELVSGVLLFLFIVWAFNQWEQKLYYQRKLLPCGRCGAIGSTQRFQGTDEYPEFYAEPVLLCSACCEAQKKWLHHRFMIGTESRLGFGRADVVAKAREDWGDRALDMVALLQVAQQDMDSARRVLTEETFQELRPWIEENLRINR